LTIRSKRFRSKKAGKKTTAVQSANCADWQFDAGSGSAGVPPVRGSSVVRGEPAGRRRSQKKNVMAMIIGNFAFLSDPPFYAVAMPSFDIVSQVNSMEIENAVNQAKKELANRFDFKNSKWEIVLEKTEIKLSAADQFKVTTLNEIVIGRLAKRGISLKSVEQCEPDISPLGHARQSIKIKQGIEATVAKQITGFIRDGKFKVTTQIQGDEVRVNGKSRDELQAVIGAVRAKELPVAVQFVNFRE
jgi:uncharacterized protein YajQ (UPF0234 family)